MARGTLAKEPIAIVGGACRFSGDANSPSKLWELLEKPRNVRREIPENRFNIQGFYHPNYAHHGHFNVKHSYMLNDDPTVFDAGFFGINPLEARAMDPQQRLLLETVYEAIESGGLTIEGLQGSDTAVYAGVMTADYEAMLLRDLDVAPTYVAVGTSRAVLSNRISYFFDWHGASVTMDTACSSSLIAVHMAMQTLRAGDSRMAVACGANVILGPESYIIESKVKMLSPDGLGRMWDKDANGYARGDGVAAIVLKPLSAALEDNDDIQCLIRETGINQDGTTTGLTMPNAAAQRSLIQSTYAKAGLDLSVLANHPQYFEAHGTGTPAGDPVEAEAISTAFFGSERDINAEAGNRPLYVGSIKTVLGHTEGTAGIAAVLKAMLAIQNSSIPPNLLFNELSPSVAPFYDNLEILSTARPWPDVPKNQPKRASVNSFGFGGANAHAILESYEEPVENGVGDSTALFTPFVFSAASDHSLRANLSAYVKYLETNPNISPCDLAYTLRQRRSTFPYRISFPATDVNRLKSKISAKLEGQESSLDGRTLVRNEGSHKILGVFTGQGAQYAGMGAELIRRSPLALQIIQTLESSLAQLPDEDRPIWSLEAEILADPSASHINDSAISQPLNTAVQIMLVDLLRSANVHFDAVIGHSGGEVAAAYAAGFLTARDALCIAYYRGISCRYATSPNGNREGAMLAVGTSMEDALQLCEDEDFDGRISLAAVNSSTSVTISGDEDAIEELAGIMEEEKKFHRRLKVDKGYHSKHMQPAAAPYLKGIRRAGIKVQAPSLSRPCTWYSSVFDGTPVDMSFELADQYWVDNMVKPVLFSQALTAALLSGTRFDAALEIGPHPALRSPAVQTVQDVLQKTVPYQGTLLRGSDAIEDFSNSLGFLWSHLDRRSINLGSCEVAMSGGKQRFHVLKGLPSYQWSHETKYWHESRRSLQLRLRQHPFHPLLGDMTAESGPHALRWKNILKPSEIPWVQGHSVQNQIVFPAAGYVSTAVEAAQFLADGRSIRLIELENFFIRQAVTFDGNDTGVEVLIELSQISRIESNSIKAHFTYSAAPGGESTDLSLAADGHLKVCLGETSPDLLPRRQPAPPHMINVEESRLYNYLASLEYNFSGPFRSLVELKRKLGSARCTARKALTPDCESVLIHPADLDAAFQSINLAYSYPGDEQLRNLHLPTTVDKIRVNPAPFAIKEDVKDCIDIDSFCNPDDRSAPGSGFSGNVNLYVNKCPNAAIQVDHVSFKPVGTTANDDRKIFCKMDWVPTKPDGTAAADDIPVSQYERELMWVLSRIVNFYVRQFDRDVPEDSSARKQSPNSHYLNYIRHMKGLLERGENRFAKQEWLNDSLEDVMDHIHATGVENNADVRIMLLVGEIMPKVFKGETNMLEHFRISGLLDKYYATGFGTQQSGLWLSAMVKQLTDRHPRLKLMEIGAGTGGATKHILNAIDRSFDSYTFTDISSSFFENAAEYFSTWRDRMIFKTCDAEHDPVEQGYTEGTYDVIIACQVLHATAKLDTTIRNLRKLLKPGGYLLIGEGSSEGMVQYGAGFIFGTLPGWWLGVDEGRILSPLASVSQWDIILRRNGFSGISTMHPPKLFDTFGLTLLCSQAVDTRMELIRDPLSSPANLPSKEVIIIGGQTEAVAHLVQGLSQILSGLGSQVFTYKTLEKLDDMVMNPGATILCLADLDKPVFQDITPERWYGFRKLFVGEKSVLWLTRGRLEDEPYCNMTVGFSRSAAHEEDDLRLQFLDIPDVREIDAQTIAETFVRFINKQLEGEDILYTVEPEIIIDSQGRELVPRLGYMSAANDRLNSIRRPIMHEVDLRESAAELQQDSSGCYIRQLSRFETSEDLIGPETIRMRTTHTILSALRTPFGHQYLALGFDTSGRSYLTLLSSLTNVVQVPKESAVPCDLSRFPENAILTLTAAQLVAMAIIDPILAGQKLVVYNASGVIAQAITVQAHEKGVEVMFITDNVNAAATQSSWIQLSPYMGRSELSRTIPANLACFVSFSTHVSENELTYLSILSPHCHRENIKSLFSLCAIDTGTSSPVMLRQILERAIRYVTSAEHKSTSKEVGVEELVGTESPNDPLTVINWTTATVVPARVSRFDNKPLFKTDRTYWLCGLSGALGISLCDWMIDRGVRNLVLTSRNPKVDTAWIKDHRRNGVIIETMSCDVTDEKALRAVHQTIVETFPPIVGVLNGAMVLRDVTVPNMQFEQMQDVYRPKVLGSMNLDRIFHSVELDFFVLLSSANCIIGNVGQANYAAANMGMVSVAAHRRKRGLRSSTANVGAIIGVGYITESASRLDLTVANTHLIHLNEEDFHQIFAEVLEAGYQDSPAGPEITTGILEVSPDEPNMPKWFSEPKFARLILHSTAGGDDKKERMNEASIQESLQGCKSKQDVFDVVKLAFAVQLRKTLQISNADDDIMSSRSSDLGLDSLISVDIRSWFLKTFQVSIPVLKIMSGDAHMSDMVDTVVEGIPAELIPSVQGDGGEVGSKDASDTSSSTGMQASPSNAESPTTPTTPLSADSDGLIDWDAEVCPPEGVTKLLDVKPPSPTPRVILLTGASGLLGHHLLNALLAQSSIRKVICIAVRRLAERVGSGQLPPPGDRIEYYEGDLAVPRFGLTEEHQAAIFNEVDAVIHNGADTSHLKYYAASRAANVESTRQLIRLCLQRMIPLHYVSSAGMALFAGRDPFPSISGTTTGKKPSPDGKHGYMCSKWVCESLLERVNAKDGLSVWIQRPSTIVREGDDAITAAADFDWVNTLLHYSHRIQAVPRIENNKGTFDLVYVQTCCDDIVGELLRNEPKLPNGMTYVNNVGDLVIPMARMAEIAKHKGKKDLYQVLPWEEWMRKAIAAGLHPAVAALVETFDEPGAPSYPGLLKADA